jgi:hypothetical protein
MSEMPPTISRSQRKPRIAETEVRKVTLLLGVGILFLPLVFVWFLCRAGHSTLARIVGFGWLVISMLIVGTISPPPAATEKPAAAGGFSEDSTTAEAKAKVVSINTKDDFRANYKSMMALSKRCDDSLSATSSWLKAGDAIRAYDAAKNTQAVCYDVSANIRQLDIPAGVAGEARAKLEEAHEKCASAYSTRAYQMSKVMKVLDGDMRPSKLSEINLIRDSGDAGILLCQAGYMSAGSVLGVDPNFFMSKAK